MKVAMDIDLYCNFEDAENVSVSMYVGDSDQPAITINKTLPEMVDEYFGYHTLADGTIPERHHKDIDDLIESLEEAVEYAYKVAAYMGVNNVSE